jgi:hypothetical protein
MPRSSRHSAVHRKRSRSLRAVRNLGAFLASPEAERLADERIAIFDNRCGARSKLAGSTEAFCGAQTVVIRFDDVQRRNIETVTVPKPMQ